MLMQYKLTESTYQKFISILKTANDSFFLPWIWLNLTFDCNPVICKTHAILSIHCRNPCYCLYVIFLLTCSNSTFLLAYWAERLAENDERDTDPAQTPAQAATQVCGPRGERGGDRRPHAHTHAAVLTTGSLGVFNPALDFRLHSAQSPSLVCFQSGCLLHNFLQTCCCYDTYFASLMNCTQRQTHSVTPGPKLMNQTILM